MKLGDNVGEYYNHFVKTYWRVHPGHRIGDKTEEHIEHFLTEMPDHLQDEVVEDGPKTLHEA